MPTETNLEFLEEIDIKEEIHSDDEEENAQNKNLTQNFQNNSSKSCVNVHILSYKDVEGIKEEIDSENEYEEEVVEELEQFEDENWTEIDNQEVLREFRDENSQESSENEIVGLIRSESSYFLPRISQRHKNKSKLQKTCPENSEIDENLDKTVEIKTEDEVELKIIQLSEPNRAISHLNSSIGYQNYSNDLSSIIKFEEEDEPNFRVENQANFEDRSLKNQEFNLRSSSCMEMDPEDQEDNDNLQNIEDLGTINHNLTFQSHKDLKVKQEIEDSSEILESWHNNTLNPHLSHRMYIKQEEEVNFTDVFTENLQHDSENQKLGPEDHEEPENLQDIDDLETSDQKITFFSRNYIKVKQNDQKTSKNVQNFEDFESLLQKSTFQDPSHSESTQKVTINHQNSQKTNINSQNLQNHQKTNQNHQKPTQNLPLTIQTYIKQEPEINLTHILPENYLEDQILRESSKIFGNQMKISDPCSLKLLKLSKMLEKPTQNEKILSKISELTMKDSQAISQAATSWAHVITKSIKLDREDITELPDEIMEKYKIQKFSMNFEKREGQVVHIYNIPYYTCTSCSTVFITQNVFFIHYKILHATVEKPFDCWKCPTSYGTWKDLMVHKKCHEDNRLYSCKYCFYQFKLRESLVKHLEKVHVEKIQNISCEICGRNFDTEREMLIHKNRHNGKGKIIKVGPTKSCSSYGQRLNGIKCIFCPAQFLKNDDLEKHYETHKALEKMKCRSCGKELMVKPQYIIKNIKMREFKCISCDLAASDKKSGNDVLKSIKIVKNLITIENCAQKKIVDKTTSSESGNSGEILKEETRKVITMTMDKETKKLSVKCYVCGIELSSNIKLFWHMKGHLEQHQYNCPVCRKDFKSRELMIEHCQTEHSKTNVTKCEICNKEFHFVDLATHMKTHVVPQGTKPTVIIPKPPKIIRLDAISEPPKASKSTNQAKTTQKVMLPTIHTYKSTGIIVKPSSKEESVFYGAKCPTCKEYVLYKDMAVHNIKHDKEQTSKLIQRIQNGRKREEFLNKLRNPSSGLSDGRKIVGSSGTRVILKRKVEVSETSGMEKKIKIEEENS